MNHMPFLVAKDLKFDVVRILNKLLNVNAGVPERLFRLSPGGAIAFNQRDVVVSRPHSTAAAACNGLDHDRITNSLGGGECLLFILNNSLGPGRHWNASLLGK